MTARSTIRPARRWEAIDWSALWHAREILFAFASRDITLRYRQTALGVLWVVLQPLLGAGIFAFVFGRIARFDSGSVPYVLFAYAGLLGWNLFSGIVLKSTTSLVSNAALISKVAFPRLLLPLSGVASCLLDFAVGVLGGALLAVLHGFVPGPWLVLSPLWLLLLVVFATGLGLIFGSLAVAYRDVVHALPVLLQLFLYASPVGYGLGMVPEGWTRSLYLLNPLATLIEGFRSALLGSGPPGGDWIGYAVVMSALTLGVGLLVFRARERDFADVI